MLHAVGCDACPNRLAGRSDVGTAWPDSGKPKAKHQQYRGGFHGLAVNA
jgi:hypothetical protein